MISIQSTTLRFGIGCFETIKVYDNQKVAFLDEHLERLALGAQICEFQIYNKEKIKKEILSYIKNCSQENILRIIATPETNIQYFVQPYIKPKIQNLKLNISSNWFRQSKSPLNAFKSFNYLSNYLALNQALEAGFDDSLILNEKKQITETTKANLFFLNQENLWLTPTLTSGCLPGIIRAKLINFLKAKEVNLKVSDLNNIKSIIATNSLIEAQNIVQINQQNFIPLDLKPIKAFLYKISS